MGSSGSRCEEATLHTMLSMAKELESVHGPSDLVLVVQETHFRVHRRVLMENSLYFRAMLTSFSESNCQSVELKHVVDPKLVAQALHFMYFKQSPLRPSSVHSLLSLSSYLQMWSLERECCCFIEKRIDIHNCIVLLQHSEHLGPHRLHRRLENFIVTHFEMVVKRCGDFVNISRKQLLRLLANEHLVVSSESVVHMAIMVWVRHDLTDRAHHLGPLLQHVQLLLMTKEELRSLANEPIVKRHINVDMALSSSKASEQRSRLWHRGQRRRWPKMMVVMRLYWRNLPMQMYDFEKNKWNHLAEVAVWRSCAALVADNALIYVIGGESEADNGSKECSNSKRTVNLVSRFDCDSNLWTTAAPMTLARRWAAAAIVGRSLFVLGGIGGRSGDRERRLHDVEKIDLDTLESSSDSSSWISCAPMSSARSSHSAAAMEGKVYVLGGGDGRNWLNSAEVYCPQSDKWQGIRSLTSRRWKCGLCALNGFLYAVGGMESTEAGVWGRPLASVEKYCPDDDSWLNVAAMRESRFGCAVVAYRGKMYVAGGFGVDKSVLDSVEVYDPDNDKWNYVDNMGSMAGFVGACLVDTPMRLLHNLC